jgi:hypothetical protein
VLETSTSSPDQEVTIPTRQLAVQGKPHQRRSVMTTTADTYKTAASQAREVTDRSVEAWKRSAKTVVDQATAVTKLPTVDLVQPIERYFEYVQKSVDLNRDLATRWAELVTSMTGSLRESAEKVSSVVKEQTESAADAVADIATAQAKKGEEVAQDQAELAEKAEKEQARLAKQAERAAAKEAHAKAREPYEELTKAELSDQLAERGLPKSGTVEELIERLVSADSE